MINEERLIEDFMNNYLVKNDGTWNDAMDRAVELAKTAPKIGGWIPCSDQLPDKWEDVMICYYNDREEKHLSDIACLDDDGNWKLWRESGGYFPYNFKKKITHWRPLPDLPEECHG